MSTRGASLPVPPLRFFARLRAFDIACPVCDRVQAVNTQTNRRIWDPRVARFQCMGCFAVFHVGTVLWNAAPGPGRYATPSDQLPTVAQALALRRQLNLYTQTKLLRGRDTNVVFEELPSVEELPARLEAGEAGGERVDARRLDARRAKA